jgi:hypothetical protein
MAWLRDRRLSVAAPVALIAVLLVALFRLDCTSSDGAEPPPLLGVVGSPERRTYVPPTPTPEGFAPTPRPRPTIPGLPGTAEERDAERLRHVLIILDGMQQLRRRDGAYPTTGGNLQSLCVFVEIDAGCQLEEVLGTEPPFDPRGRGSTNGYWYQSDGATAILYFGFETAEAAGEVCEDPHPGFAELDVGYLVCPTLP